MDFGLSFFSSTGNEFPGAKYELLTRCARFADEQGLTAVWTPERHFHSFGGVFPNPSLMGAHLANVTRQVRIRAGSVVVPLHHPIRIAEEWSVVDNLSRGRVDISFATGWHPDDFLISPEQFPDRTELTLAGIERIRGLWRGESFEGQNGLGEPITVRVHPSPIQKELPVWLTCTGKPERFSQAGERGYNVLTALIFQSISKLTERIREYRKARQRAGLDPEAGRVTLMLHTFLGESLDAVREIVHEPLKNYLRSSVDLWRRENKSLEKLTERDDALEFSFRRYFGTSGLFGSVESCRDRIEQLAAIGVDEIACLVDFGVPPTLTFESLSRLSDLARLFRG